MLSHLPQIVVLSANTLDCILLILHYSLVDHASPQNRAKTGQDGHENDAFLDVDEISQDLRLLFDVTGLVTLFSRLSGLVVPHLPQDGVRQNSH